MLRPLLQQGKLSSPGPLTCPARVAQKVAPPLAQEVKLLPVVALVLGAAFGHQPLLLTLEQPEGGAIHQLLPAQAHQAAGPHQLGGRQLGQHAQQQRLGQLLQVRRRLLLLLLLLLGPLLPGARLLRAGFLLLPLRAHLLRLTQALCRRERGGGGGCDSAQNIPLQASEPRRVGYLPLTHPRTIRNRGPRLCGQRPAPSGGDPRGLGPQTSAQSEEFPGRASKPERLTATDNLILRAPI